jgi:hypothetical protein
MEREAIRPLIREKLANGCLPHDSLAKIWGGKGKGEMCLACDTPVENGDFLIEGIGADEQAVQFHTRCFYYLALRGRPSGLREP